ncbi:MAG TPA: hypothetical protein VNT25_00350 [Allosphingosinicella sp.]|nr:hypothetical protein [Allosphingosinicella sp.]
MMKAVLAAASLIPLGACQLPPTAIGGSSGASCPIIGSTDWRAWVNAMPGPNARPTLIVMGKVTVPTGGYRLGLSLGPVQESNPPVQRVHLNVTPPSGGATDALVTHEVRGEFPALAQYGAVTVHCGNRPIASISPVERAY